MDKNLYILNYDAENKNGKKELVFIEVWARNFGDAELSGASEIQSAYSQYVIGDLVCILLKRKG